MLPSCHLNGRENATNTNKGNLTKSEEKKRKKRAEILDSAYTLFTTIGFHNTTMLAIALKAGVGKGTSYLYFDSKNHIRDELVMQKSSAVLLSAVAALNKAIDKSKTPIMVSDRIVFIVDYILDVLTADPKLLNFIAKNLSYGLLYENTAFSDENEGVINFKTFVADAFARDSIELKDPELTLFTIIELVSSTCYSVILKGTPVSLADYKPHLHHIIRLIVEDAVIKDVEG